MNTVSQRAPVTWLRTEHPVIPVNPTAWEFLPEVEAALHRGVAATADNHRPGFYEIEIGDNWYYIHVPSRLRAVYIVAAQNRLASGPSGISAQLRAC